MDRLKPQPECPYVGLVPFEAAHADYFFGRRLDSAVLADNLLARRITVLYGASGVGKSSVLNVGLPRALFELGVAATCVSRRDWHEPARLTAWLEEMADAARAAPERPLIVVLDQFEEYFLYADAEQVRAFAKSLAALITCPDFDARLLLAVRDDGLHRLDALRFHLPTLLETTLELRHLDDAAVHEAIEQPIAVWNACHSPIVALDPDFAETLIEQLRPRDDSGRPLKGVGIELSYLQLALEKIWEAQGGAAATALRTVTLTERLKGIGEIARRHVEEVFGDLHEEDQALCTIVFDRLVTPSGGKVLYATADLAALAKTDPARMENVLAQLASGKTRILRAVVLPGAKHASGYEILHDILARPILEWIGRRAAKLERDRADAEARARHQAELDRAGLAKQRIALVALAILLAGALGWVVWSDQKRKSADQAAREEEDKRRASFNWRGKGA